MDHPRCDQRRFGSHKRRGSILRGGIDENTRQGTVDPANYIVPNPWLCPLALCGDMHGLYIYIRGFGFEALSSDSSVLRKLRC